MKISDLVERSGTPRSTIQYYLREGLLHPPDKTGRTMAYYDEIHLRLLKEIHRIKMTQLKKTKGSRVPIEAIKSRLYQERNGKSPIKSGKRLLKDKKSPGENKRQKILEAATRIYLKQGYYPTTVQEVAREAGISLPTFYKYFPDKRELFFEVIEQVIGDYLQKSREAVQKEENPARRSGVMIRIFFENYPKICEILNQLKAGLAINDQWAREKLIKVYGDLTRGLVRELNRGITDGFIRKNMDTELLAFFLLAIAEAEVYRSSLDSKYSMIELALFASELQFNGFLTSKGREMMQPYLSVTNSAD